MPDFSIRARINWLTQINRLTLSRSQGLHLSWHVPTFLSRQAPSRQAPNAPDEAYRNSSLGLHWPVSSARIAGACPQSAFCSSMLLCLCRACQFRRAEHPRGRSKPFSCTHCREFAEVEADLRTMSPQVGTPPNSIFVRPVVSYPHPPRPSNRQTGMPSTRALSARFPVMPEPGKTMAPIGNVCRSASLRLKGAALACLVPA